MRKGEVAKIKIKKKYGFGRKLNTEALKFPPGYDELGSDKHKRLTTKGIIYEVKLVDWIERTDIEGDGNFLKTVVSKAQSKEWERAKERDEVEVTVRAYYKPEDVIFEKENWSTYPTAPDMTETFRIILESLKQTEHSSVSVKPAFILDHDPALLTLLGAKYQADKELTVEMHLHKLVKVEDWFKDGGSCLKRVVRKGKGSSPSTDSNIKGKINI